MIRSEEGIRTRLTIYFIIFVSIFVLLFSRLWYLQVMAEKNFSQLAERNRIREISIDSLRGSIFDRKGEILVNNRPAFSVIAYPVLLNDKEAVNRLANLLQIEPVEIEEKLKKYRGSFLFSRVIKKDVSLKIISYIKEHQDEFPGVNVSIIPVRNYLEKNLAAHILGYLGEISDEELKMKNFADCQLGDEVGKTGIERFYDSILRGVKGKRKLEVNAFGRPLRVLEEEKPLAGYDLYLTIDKDLQRFVENALKEGIKLAHQQGYRKARAGAIIVMNPQNGEVLALASFPSYNPSLLSGSLSPKDWAYFKSKKSNYPLFNRAVMAVYPPGSIFKPFTLVAGLAEGVVNYSSVFLCEGKWIGMGKSWPKYCWKRSGHGRVGLGVGLADSCDVVFYEIGYKFYKIYRKTKAEILQDWAREYGFGSKTNIELSSEAKGTVPDAKWKGAHYQHPQEKIWLPGDTVNMAIGQGDLLVTPIQIAVAYSALANGGTLFQPHLVKKLGDSKSKVVHLIKAEVKSKISVSPSILNKIKRDLKRVVTEGTAKDAFLGFSLPVAGKTGTAEVKGKENFSWFACFTPIQKPEYVIVVLIEEGGHGGSVAAPVARKILSYLYHQPIILPAGIKDFSR